MKLCHLVWPFLVVESVFLPIIWCAFSDGGFNSPNSLIQSGSSNYQQQTSYGGGGGGGGGEGGSKKMGPIQTGIESHRTVEVKPVQLMTEPHEPQVIEVPSEDTPVTVHFKSQSSRVLLQQTHTPAQSTDPEHTSSEDEPQKVIHEVVKPVIQEIREIIQPYRRVVQQIQPVIEQTHTVIAKGEPRPQVQPLSVPNASPGTLSGPMGGGSGGGGGGSKYDNSGSGYAAASSSLSIKSAQPNSPPELEISSKPSSNIRQQNNPISALFEMSAAAAPSLQQQQQRQQNSQPQQQSFSNNKMKNVPTKQQKQQNYIYQQQQQQPSSQHHHQSQYQNQESHQQPFHFQQQQQSSQIQSPPQQFFSQNNAYSARRGDYGEQQQVSASTKTKMTLRPATGELSNLRPTQTKISLKPVSMPYNDYHSSPQSHQSHQYPVSKMALDRRSDYQMMRQHAEPFVPMSSFVYNTLALPETLQLNRDLPMMTFVAQPVRYRARA